MRKITLLAATALGILAFAAAGITLSSDPEWRALPSKGTDVVLEELTLEATGAGPLTGSVDVTFKSDYF